VRLPVADQEVEVVRAVVSDDASGAGVRDVKAVLSAARSPLAR